MKGNIFSIVRASLHDGNGVRTVVYFKGCSLKCVWCHNPEGILFDDEVMYYADKCISCGRCQSVCPEHHTENGYIRTGCSVCGKCADICPANALVMCGQLYDVDTLFNVIVKDKHYYDITNGGVTFSGGECFMQSDYLRAIAHKCRSNGINTTAESALNFPESYLDIAIDEMDSMIVDLKHMDNTIHKMYTGYGNEQILKNIQYLSEHHSDITIRIPMIPVINDSEYNLTATAEFINQCGGGIKKVELLKYNNLAGNKYTVLGISAESFKALPQTDDEMKKYNDIIRNHLKGEVILLA